MRWHQTPSVQPTPWRASMAVLAVALIGWSFIAWIALDADGTLAQSTMPMSAHWSASNTVVIAVMWFAMMAAMMLPSTLPMVEAFVLTVGRDAGARTMAFVATYLAVWASFSLIAVLGQWMLQRSNVLDPMMLRTSPWPATALLVLAGVYQFTGLKQLCLAGCRNPVAFLLTEWRPGISGAAKMGLRHGSLCVGCCWGLMALLFVGGVMNLPWVAALALAVAFEKLLPKGVWVSRAVGWALTAAGIGSLVARIA